MNIHWVYFETLLRTFDTVNHEILLRSTEETRSSWNLAGIANEWFKDYLTNRKEK